MTETSPNQEDIKRALERVSAWPEMARSPQLTRFLDYIVQRSLRGEAPSIKAYSIAVDVFGRPADFDPQTDPIVRVQARRLRGLLEQFYSGPGADETLRIVLPVGRYVPEFVSMTGTGETAIPAPDGVALPLADRPKRGQVTVSWFVLLVIALGAAALAFSLSTWGPRQEALARSAGLQRPVVTVVEFQNATGDAAKLSTAAGLAMSVVTDLQAFGTVDVRFDNSFDEQDEQEDNSDFLLTGMVRRGPVGANALQYSVNLTDRPSGAVVWTRTITVDEAVISEPQGLGAISLQFVSALGSMRGPLHGRAREMLAQNSVDGQENVYLCRTLFDIYRDTSAFSAAERAQFCFDALSERDRQSGPVMAAMASLLAEQTRSSPTPERVERLARASDLLSSALTLAPTDAFVWEQRARLHELNGLHDYAEAAYGSSLQLNPASMDALAARARHLALMGRLAEAVPMARQAIDGAPSPPRWYMAVPALDALSQSDFGEALRLAEIYSQSDRELGPIFAVLAAQGLDDADIVNIYLPRVMEVPSFRGNGILPRLRQRISDSSFIELIRKALEAAGVPRGALTQPF